MASFKCLIFSLWKNVLILFSMLDEPLISAKTITQKQLMLSFIRIQFIANCWCTLLIHSLKSGWLFILNINLYGNSYLDWIKWMYPSKIQLKTFETNHTCGRTYGFFERIEIKEMVQFKTIFTAYTWAGARIQLTQQQQHNK